MTRTVFVIGAVAWLLVGIGIMGVAVLGREWLLARLPPLAIDADALGGALTAVALAVLTVGATHIVLLIGIARGARWARSAGALVASVLAAVLLGLAAAAVSSSLREAAYVVPLIGSALLAAVGMLAYLLVAVRLARELGSGSAA
ncbi:MAG: hypothetical protein ACT4OQ_13340 [Chloroflexota bacterium]